MRQFIWILFFISSLLYLIPNNKILNINFTYSDAVYIVIFSILLIKNLYEKQSIIFSKNINFIAYMLYFLTIGILLSSLRAKVPLESITSLFQYLFIFIVLLNIIVYLYNEKPRNAKKILGVFIIPYIINIALVVLSKYNLYNGLDDIIISNNGRYQGLNYIATGFGNEIVMASIIIMYFVYSLKNKLLKSIAIILLIFSIYTILLTGSFGALFILSAFFVLFLWFGVKHKLIGISISVLLLIVISTSYYQIEVKNNLTVLSYLPDILEERYISSGEDFGSSEVRGNLNEIAFYEFIENPLPLPKKHVKKTMDYAIVPQSVYMKYDIEVSDLDDFDV